ncbi:hypothetical protein [Streptomyces subrutilus]|uniref:Uncharacterized protein n=1 Tax=Streptomyces subrutilus TaxID=36818 RepID=A0A5P2UW97_9ACTN|nr:hypothetical protein [Streptomyces subrutilus]QEU83170.1 hypothetical protein CP968_26120 [Streptomyces subrutilus]WSJ29371.1 hypothetical protein OG479_08620 [Streptomyces subrutilus]GGZ85556.1 hypothetical protein GCM10010371_51820 [Streptomyces subrutilus]
MAGFRSLAYQVRDARNDRALRRHSLRRCLERFAPYGHRATWWHLCDRHGIAPEDRGADPLRLVAALEELEEARAVWLEYERQFAERRRREKHHGLRRPEWAWGGSGDAVVRCADPGVRPEGALGEVLRRLVRALESEPGTGCPICGDEELKWPGAIPLQGAGPRAHPGHGAVHGAGPGPWEGAWAWDGPVCAGCGIVVPRPALTEAPAAGAA